MKTDSLPFLLATVIAWTTLVPAEASARPSSPGSKQKIILNGFRMPSIGLEYRRNEFSWHVGLYPTIVSEKNASGKYATTWFSRVGMSWWPRNYLFVDASYLYGLNQAYRNDHGLILNPGLQYTFMDAVMLRLGVAVLASPDHPLKFNPTPGIGFGFDI